MNGVRVVVVVVLTLTRKIKPVVTRQAPVTLELRNTPQTGGKRVRVRRQPPLSRDLTKNNHKNTKNIIITSLK